MPMILSLLALAAAAQQEVRPDAHFRLVCVGAGSAAQPSSGTAMAYGNYGDSYTITTTGLGRVAFRGVMQIDINGKEGTVRVPPVMLPAIRGGNNGVIKLKDIRVSENEISARVDYNFINKPRLIIDRLSGAVSMDDRMTQADFTGSCEAFDPARHQRAF